MLESRAARIGIKTALVLLAIALSLLFFGLCLPLLLVVAGVLPNLGLGSVVYLFLGGVGGLLFGGISSACSLARSKELVTEYCWKLLATLSVLSIFYLVCQMHIDRFRHL